MQSGSLPIFQRNTLLPSSGLKSKPCKQEAQYTTRNISQDSLPLGAHLSLEPLKYKTGVIECTALSWRNRLQIHDAHQDLDPVLDFCEHDNEPCEQTHGSVLTSYSTKALHQKSADRRTWLWPDLKYYPDMYL
jgi:hypothetical protein